MEIEKINIDGFGKFHKYNALTTDKIQVFLERMRQERQRSENL